MSRSVLAWALLAAGVTSAAPVLGPGQYVTPDVVAEGQAQARAAGSADGFLVAWQAGVGRNARVRAARVGLDGHSLDASGFTVAEGLGGRFEPAVAFGHGHYLVVWSDLRAGAHAVYGARVSLQGAVLDPGGVILSTTPGARMPDVAATPTGFVVGWAQAVEGGQGTEAHARLLNADGTPSGAPLRLTQAAPWRSGEDLAHLSISRSYCQNVRITMRGGLAFIAWGGNAATNQSIDVAAATVDTSTGTIVSPAAQAMPAPVARVWHPAVASLPDGGVLLSWTDYRTRGLSGLAAHNAVVSAPDAGFGLISLKEDGGARQVVWPAVAPTSFVAFVAGVENPQRQRRLEWLLRVREVLPDGSSPGPDVTVPEQVGWPTLATGPTGVTLLVTTTVNGVAGETGRLVARTVSR